ncbi:MAG: hypothetical protein D6718_09645 [Acidobacteria bacterium]|nr:MAG: hypothetical protein D6718_09645 [Acidobacteriota bacterium]
MGPAQRLFIGLLAAVCLVFGIAAGRIAFRPRHPVTQPIAFNHKIHTELLECSDCHKYYQERAHSGLPGLSTCMDCHEEPVTESPEEQKVRDLAAEGKEQVFKKTFRLPDSVFYTHRRHVTVAGLECSTCHGAIAESEAPPEVPLVRITMNFCLECHEERGVTTDCVACHR